MCTAWPVYSERLSFPAEEEAMELIMDAIRAVRGRRSEMNVPPSKKAHLTVATMERETFTLGVPFLKKLAYASEVEIVPFTQVQADDAAAQAWQVSIVTHAAQLSIPLGELVDLEKEKQRVEKELKKQSAELDKLNAKLNNPGFVNKAHAQVVAAEKERAVQLAEQAALLINHFHGDNPSFSVVFHGRAPEGVRLCPDIRTPASSRETAREIRARAHSMSIPP